METEIYNQYRKKQTSEMREYIDGEPMDGITVADEDRRGGSPRKGDMIARNPNNHNDKWLVSEKYFNDNYVPA